MYLAVCKIYGLLHVRGITYLYVINVMIFVNAITCYYEIIKKFWFFWKYFYSDDPLKPNGYVCMYHLP
jgi:hypothetical protein